MNIRGTLKWLLFLVVVVGIGVAATAWWYWKRSDEILRQELLSHLAEALPGWEIDIGDARFDWDNQSKIYLSELRVAIAGESEPLLVIPTAVVHVDGDLLKENLQVILRRVEINDPRINLIREADGTWNFQRLPPPPRTKEAGFPELAVRRAAISVELHHTEVSLSTKLPVDHGELRLIPKARQVYQIDGLAELRNAGTLRLQGEWDLSRGRWRLDGSMENLAVDRQFMELLTDAAPATRETLTRVDARLHQSVLEWRTRDRLQFDRVFFDDLPEDALSQTVPRVVPASHRSETPPAASPSDPSGLPEFGLTGNVNLNFRLSRASAEDALEYRLLASLSKGQLDNPLLPFPLREVECKCYLDRGQLLVRDFRAINGETEIRLHADVSLIGQATPGIVQARVANLPVTERLKKVLRPDLQKMFDLLHPTGDVDFQGTLEYDGFGRWTQRDVSYTLRNGTSQPNFFSYRVQDIAGTIVPRVEPDGRTLYDYRFQGVMGRRPVVLTGWSRPAHEGGEALFELAVEQLPVDETFLNACQSEIREPLRLLDVRGKTNARVRVARAAGETQKFHQTIDAEFYDGSFEYVRFPYAVQGVTAKIRFDSHAGICRIEDVEGRHGDARVLASGTYTRGRAPARLELNVALEDAPLDHQLEHALREADQTFWDQLAPQGRLTAIGTVVWVPDRESLEITLPSIRVREGNLLMREFRYPLERVEALLSYADRRVEIREFKAWHDTTRIRLQEEQGRGEFVQEADGWRLRFENLLVDDLQPDRGFRKALPEALRDGFETLDPDGPVSIHAHVLEFRGHASPRIPVTAAWNLEGYVAGLDFTAGVRFSNAHGKFTARGTWDGRIVDGGGRIDLDSLVVMNQQLTQVRGPFRALDREIVVGSREAFSSDPATARSAEHLTARAFEGVLTVDAVATIGEDQVDAYGRIPKDPTRYRVALGLNGPRLEEYARRNLTGVTDLRGIVNGGILLEGEGTRVEDLTGSGTVVVKPAALYELPVMFQVFQRLTFVPPDNTAFDEARLAFKIRNEQFEFDRIDLLGNAISLRGRGTIRFDEKVDLEFISAVPKAQLPIPLVRELVNASQNGFMAVRVGGTIAQPVTNVQTNLVIDRAMRDFLGGFQPFAPLFPAAPNTPGSRPANPFFLPPQPPRSGQVVPRQRS